MHVVTGAEMAEIDRQTIETIGIPGRVLMESAGRALADTIALQRGRVAVLAGPGNNGGDGFVVARVLAARGLQVTTWLTRPVDSYRGDAQANLSVLEALAADCQVVPETDPDFSRYDLIVDAVFGTGLGRPVEGRLAQLFAAVNKARKPVVAVDIPSGICSATGRLLGHAIGAETTVTFGLPKVGHYLFPGASYRGRLVVADIGFPPQLLLGGPGQLLDARGVARMLPERPPTSHKGTCGRAFLLAGSERYPGAAALATRGALRGGAGLVYLSTPAPAASVVLAQLPEAIVVRESDSQAVATADALCLGPGTGERAEACRALLSAGKPTVVDADALGLLPGAASAAGRILTPHPGELGRLLGRSVCDLESDRVSAARQAAVDFSAVVVAKGAPTVVANPQGQYWINTTGGPHLSQGGMGDVLAGLITALLAQGLASDMAACAGVFLHGLASDLAAERLGPRGLAASQVADRIPHAYREVFIQYNRTIHEA